MPGASRQSTPGHHHRPPEHPTYHHQPPGLYHPPTSEQSHLVTKIGTNTRPASYCDLHCQGKHEVTRRQNREASDHWWCLFGLYIYLLSVKLLHNTLVCYVVSWDCLSWWDYWIKRFSSRNLISLLLHHHKEHRKIILQKTQLVLITCIYGSFLFVLKMTTYTKLKKLWNHH